MRNTHHRNCRTIKWFFPIWGLLAITTLTEAKDLRVTNDSVYLGNGNWQWSVFLKGSKTLLDEIRCVKYIPLHPGAPIPEKPICDKGRLDKPYAWTESWYGAFKVRVTVTFKSQKQRDFEHLLIFSSPQIEKDKELPIEGENTAQELRPRLYDWKIFIKVKKGIPKQKWNKILDNIQCTEYTLLPSFLHPVMEICERGKESQPFALKAASWGTFTVNIRVFLKNGKTQYFKHRLKP